MAKSSKLQSGRASLCALGEHLRRLQFFAPLREQVKIPQKTVKHQPVDKLLDALMGMLCGAKTVAQSNVTVRVASGLAEAFPSHRPALSGDCMRAAWSGGPLSMTHRYESQQGFSCGPVPVVPPRLDFGVFCLSPRKGSIHAGND